MCSPCFCTLSASASIHPPIPTFGRFLLEIFFKFLVTIRDLLTHTCNNEATVEIQQLNCNKEGLHPAASPLGCWASLTCKLWYTCYIFILYNAINSSASVLWSVSHVMLFRITLCEHLVHCLKLSKG